MQLSSALVQQSNKANARKSKRYLSKITIDGSFILISFKLANSFRNKNKQLLRTLANT